MPGLALKLGLGLNPNKGVGYSISNLFAGGADGLDFAPLNVDGQYQEPTGQTAANDADEVIGFMPDRHSWGGVSLTALLAAQTELYGAAWTNRSSGTGTSSFSTPTLTLTTTDGANRGAADTPLVTVADQTYEIDLTYVSGPVGALNIQAYSAAAKGGTLLGVANSQSTGAKRLIFKAIGSASYLYVEGAAAGTYALTPFSTKLIPGNHGIQSTAGFKPKYQTSGAKFDGTDDNELTTYLAQAGANCIVAYVDVPATLAATQVVAGASGAAANRCFLAFNTSGQLCGGVGSDSTTTIVGTTDWRGQTVVVCLSVDGSTVKLFAGTAEEYSAAQNSTPTTTIPFRIGGLNNNGTAGSFCAHYVRRLLVGRKALTIAQFRSIRTQLLAGG